MYKISKPPDKQGLYFSMITSSNKNFALRKEMVSHALLHGIRPAARQFGTTRKTVKKWIQRFKANGHTGFNEHSRKPHRSPNKTSKSIEDLIIQTRKKTPGFGSKRLVEEFDLPVSHNVVHRIIKENGLVRKRRKKHHTKRDLRAIKQAYKPFTRFQMDVKHLCDLPNYFAQMKALGLPAFQYTIRELSTGAQFLTYSQELSKLYATETIKRFLTHLKQFHIDTQEVVIKTDLGSEFDGQTVKYERKGFHLTVQEEPFYAKHRFNPPARPNFNADVESVHATIEPEFYEAEKFVSREDFIRKASTYQFWYNIRRKNSSRGWKAPIDCLTEKAYHIDPRILLHYPLFLEQCFYPFGGYHVPGLTVFSQKLIGSKALYTLNHLLY